MGSKVTDYKIFKEFASGIFGEGFIPLHRPVFGGNEKQYLAECIESNFVSSVGLKVSEFENLVASFCGSKYGIATMNGTSALHVSLLLVGVNSGDEVLTQAMTFIATCNAISYCQARPVLLDIDEDTLGLSPDALKSFLAEFADVRSNGTFNRSTGRRISACLPMHTFGNPCRILEIVEICNEYGIPVVEDAAESLGSYSRGRHTGSFGKCGVFSFNGNKIITTGGGGVITTDDSQLASRAKYITTTAKVPHPWEFMHDQIAYNYRMPNLNAALGCAQMEQLDSFLAKKADLADQWDVFFTKKKINFFRPIDGNISNNWLNAIILDSKQERDEFLKNTNEIGIMTRPSWMLMSDLVMYQSCQTDGLKVSRWVQDRLVNIPSSVPG
jgi:aminotransferase in exopolysaccharide biosynthesis